MAKHLKLSVHLSPALCFFLPPWAKVEVTSTLYSLSVIHMHFCNIIIYVCTHKIYDITCF